jgi:hypothetical protein
VRVPRSLRLAGVLVVAAGLLTACAPVRQPLLAITLIGGWPVAVLRTCAGGPAEINVTENSPAPTTTPAASLSPTESPSPTVTPSTETYVFFWDVTTGAAQGLNEVPLFTTPTGWEVGTSTLKKLQPGFRYIADARVSGVLDVSPVNFTISDLHELKPDEVLYGINAPLTTVLTRSEFEKKTAEACAGVVPTTTG